MTFIPAFHGYPAFMSRTHLAGVTAAAGASGAQFAAAAGAAAAVASGIGERERNALYAMEYELDAARLNPAWVAAADRRDDREEVEWRAAAELSHSRFIALFTRVRRELQSTRRALADERRTSASLQRENESLRRQLLLYKKIIVDSVDAAAQRLDLLDEPHAPELEVSIPPSVSNYAAAGGQRSASKKIPSPKS